MVVCAHESTTCDIGRPCGTDQIGIYEAGDDRSARLQHAAIPQVAVVAGRRSAR